MKKLVFAICAFVFAVLMYAVWQKRLFDQWIKSGQQVIVTAQTNNGDRDDDLPPLLKNYLQKVILVPNSSSFVSFQQQGEFFDYKQIGSVLIPSRAQVSWLLPSGIFTYFR